MTLAELGVLAALLAEIQAVAEGENRRPEAFVLEALEFYLATHDWRSRNEREIARARELGLPDDREPLTGDYRQTARDKIARGLQSLRERKGTDGEVFFAEMEAEFDEEERQRPA